jgi:hypothetical protein
VKRHPRLGIGAEFAACFRDQALPLAGGLLLIAAAPILPRVSRRSG